MKQTKGERGKEAKEEIDVMIKMSLCPECGNAIRVAVEHTMDIKSKNSFLKEVMELNLTVKTISLEEYRASNIELYCKEGCNHIENIIE